MVRVNVKHAFESPSERADRLEKRRARRKEWERANPQEHEARKAVTKIKVKKLVESGYYRNRTIEKRRKTKDDKGAWFLRKLKRIAGDPERKFSETVDLTLSIYLPDVCPVLGVPLVYGGERCGNMASLDRWDNSLGYVDGNVYVISLRANQLKKDATSEELSAVLRYMKKPC